VLEDVIDTLIVKNVLSITDLPEQAQAKLFAHKSFRECVSNAFAAAVRADRLRRRYLSSGINSVSTP